MAQRDLGLPVHAQAQKARFAAAAFDVELPAGGTLAVGDALRRLRHAIQPQHHARAARLALGVAGIEIQPGIGDRHAARHRQVELLARIAIAQHHRLGDAQVFQRGGARHQVVALQLAQCIARGTGQRAQRREQSGRDQGAAQRADFGGRKGERHEGSGQRGHRGGCQTGEGAE
ncbi:hypothetical protein D3C72_1505220 [compost metagenome]